MLAYTRKLFCTTAVLMLTLTGCGGGDAGGGVTTPPPPPPTLVVTTVEISPASVSVVEAATVTLAATVKDQNGAIMTDQSVTWTSSAIATASVSQAGVVTGVAAGSATITAGVAGKSASSTITVTAAPRIEIETSKAVTATIGSLGGSLTTTVGAATYTLTVPPGSLLANNKIVMTPVTVLRRLPAGGEFAGGVVFSPSGLQFPKAATLRVVEPITAVAGKELYGYLANDTGAVVALSPMTRKGDTLTLRIPHFTVGGWGQFVPPQVALLPNTLPANTGNQAFINQLSALTPGTPVGTALAILQQWFTTLIVPELSNFTGNTTTEDVQAANDFDTWDTMVSTYDIILGYNGALMVAAVPLRQQGVGLLPRILVFGIAGLISDCNIHATTAFLDGYPEQVLVLQEMATIYGVDNTLGLDLPSVLRMLPTCVQVVNTRATFPASPTPNTPAQLDLRYGVQFGDSTNGLASFEVKLNMTLTGTTTDGTQVLQADFRGAISGTVVPTGQKTFVADLTACIHPSEGYLLDRICLKHQITRPFGVTLTGDVSVRTQTGLASLSNVAKITGSLTIDSDNTSGDPITSKDLRELSQLTEVARFLNISNLPSLTTLAGMASLAKVGSLGLNSDPVLAKPAIPPLLTDLPVLSVINGGLQDLAGFLGLPHIGTLHLRNIPVGSLDPLRRTLIDEVVILENLPGLTTLTGLKVATTMFFVSLQDLPNLKDITAFDAVTDLGSLIVTNPRFPAPMPFPRLRKVSDGFTLGLDPQSSSYTFPALQVVRFINVSFMNGCQGRTAPFSLGLPALQTLRQVIWRGPTASAVGCFTLPAFLSTLSLESVNIMGGGVTSVTLAHLQNSPLSPGSRGGDFGIVGPDLTQVTVLGSVNITGQIYFKLSPKLRSVSFGGSVTVQGVRGDLSSFSICDSPALTTISFSGPAQVNGGMAIIANNPNFVRPRNFPLTATGGVIITPTFDPRC